MEKLIENALETAVINTDAAQDVQKNCADVSKEAASAGFWGKC